MRKTLEGEGKDLGGRGAPLERGAPLPPNLPLSPRTSPKSTRPCRTKSCFALFGAGTLGGSFRLFWEVEIFLKVRLSRPICRRETFGDYAIHKCRDSAGRRNLGTCVWHYIVGNDPCVVPFRLKVTCCSGLCLWWVEIYPPSSVAIATNCLQFSSPQGEAFFTRCVHSKYNKHQVANNTSNSCPFILLRSTKGILQKASPRGEAVAIATDEGG